MKSFCSFSRFVYYFIDLFLLAFVISHEYRQLDDERCLLWVSGGQSKIQRIKMSEAEGEVFFTSWRHDLLWISLAYDYYEYRMSIDNERARLVHTGKNVRLICWTNTKRRTIAFFSLAKRNIINEKYCFFFFSLSFSFCLSCLKSDTHFLFQLIALNKLNEGCSMHVTTKKQKRKH